MPLTHIQFQINGPPTNIQSQRRKHTYNFKSMDHLQTFNLKEENTHTISKKQIRIQFQINVQA